MGKAAVKTFLLRSLGTIGAALLVGVLVLVIWQPVFPSWYIIKKMASSIDPVNASLDPPRIVRFELSGKGGGTYSIVAGKGTVTTVKGETDRVDLIIYMEAREFNHLMFSLARGRAAEAAFRSAILSKVMRFAGDMTVFEKLFKPKGDNQ